MIEDQTKSCSICSAPAKFVTEWATRWHDITAFETGPTELVPETKREYRCDAHKDLPVFTEYSDREVEKILRGELEKVRGKAEGDAK